ncbi:MAG: hypothetical protein QXU93_11745 [Thermoproteus sp.]
MSEPEGGINANVAVVATIALVFALLFYLAFVGILTIGVLLEVVLALSIGAFAIALTSAVSRVAEERPTEGEESVEVDREVLVRTILMGSVVQQVTHQVIQQSQQTFFEHHHHK